jgi:Spy/CpxP family protein refolding chaperone
MKMNRSWIGWTLGILGLCGTLSAAGAAGEGQTGSGTRSALERGDGFRQGSKDHHGARRRAVSGFLRHLNFSDAQRGLALQAARNAQPIVEEARREAARILVQAEDAGQNARSSAVREQLKSLRQQTFQKIEPLARQVVAALTPEQRQRIEDAARKHGRTFDEDRLVRRTARLLARPMTEALLEARLAR